MSVFTRGARKKHRRRTPRFLRPVLRPMAFRVLPRELRPTRVWRLAEALALGVRDPEFEVLLRRIDTAPLHRGNAVTVFFDGPPAFASMCDAIAAAQREVLLEAYILKDDATGRNFVDALAAAARRGVAVRVLADAFGSSDTRADFWRQMEERHIEVRLYHPLLPFLWYQPYRDHRKILVADRRVAFTGGMNIGDEYGSSLKGRGSKLWRDTHARLEGPAAWEMAVVFQEGWDRAGGKPFEIPPLELPPPDETAPPAASILVLDSSPGRGHEETASVLAAMGAAARKTFWLTNAYFAPRRGALPILARAAARGVDVRLLLPGASDVPLVRHAGHGVFRYLARAGREDLRVRNVRPARQERRRRRLRLDGRLDEHGLPVLPFQLRVQRRGPRWHRRGIARAAVRRRPRRGERDHSGRVGTADVASQIRGPLRPRPVPRPVIIAR